MNNINPNEKQSQVLIPLKQGGRALNINHNEKQSQSQNARILKHLQQGGSITSLESLDMFGCLRLSARIKDLRERGYQIASEFVIVPSGKRVKQYFMEKSLCND